MSVSCCHVLKEMGAFQKIARVFLVTMAILVSMAAFYLYIIPFTNIVGFLLFGDYKCASEGVWGACTAKTPGAAPNKWEPAGVGFLVFLMIQTSLGAILLAIVMKIIGSYYGYFAYFPDFQERCCVCRDGLCEIGGGCNRDYEYDEQPGAYARYPFPSSWVKRRPSPHLFCSNGRVGSCLTIYSSGTFIFGLFFSTLYIGIWGGRAIAVQVVPACLPFKNSQIGVYGCVENGAYVGGELCKTHCTGVGFAILGLPLFALHLIIPLIMWGIWNFVHSFRETRDVLAREQEAREAVYIPEKITMNKDAANGPNVSNGGNGYNDNNLPRYWTNIVQIYHEGVLVAAAGRKWETCPGSDSSIIAARLVGTHPVYKIPRRCLVPFGETRELVSQLLGPPLEIDMYVQDPPLAVTQQSTISHDVSPPQVSMNQCPANQEECPVCMADPVQVKLRCGHYLCHSCHNMIRVQSNTCPICRQTMYPPVSVPVPLWSKF